MIIGQPGQLVIEGVAAAAASRPAWRQPPPSRLRSTRARAMFSAVLTSIEPTGAPRPLEKQTLTVSNSEP